MATRKRVQNAWHSILNQVGNPPIRLLSEKEWKEMFGHGIGSFCGRAQPVQRVIAVRFMERTLDAVKETLWHELGHILFPHKPHWWIECYGNIMSSFYSLNRYSVRYGHSVHDLPSRSELLRLSIEAAKMFQAPGGNDVN